MTCREQWCFLALTSEVVMLNALTYSLKINEIGSCIPNIKSRFTSSPWKPGNHFLCSRLTIIILSGAKLPMKYLFHFLWEGRIRSEFWFPSLFWSFQHTSLFSVVNVTIPFFIKQHCFLKLIGKNWFWSDKHIDSNVLLILYLSNNKISNKCAEIL